MKVFADLSALIKVVLVCLVIGFVVGVCMNATSWPPRSASDRIAPGPAAPAK